MTGVASLRKPDADAAEVAKELLSHPAAALAFIVDGVGVLLSKNKEDRLDVVFVVVGDEQDKVGLHGLPSSCSS